MRDITDIVYHHTAGSNYDCHKALEVYSPQHKRKYHDAFPKNPMVQSLGYYLSYHYLIDIEGNYLATREHKDVGYHAGNHKINKHSIAICFIGNYVNREPNQKQLETASKITENLKAKYNIKSENIVGHRNIKPTACPGFSNETVKKLAYGLIDYLKPQISSWALDSVNKAIETGIATEWENPQEIIGNETLGWILKKAGISEKVFEGGVTKEQFITILDKLGMIK